MDDRFNTAAGWVLFSGIVALGLTAISSRLFDVERPETLGYPVAVANEGGAEAAGPDLGVLLAAADIAKGETEAAARCGACHTFTQGGAAGTGPNLFGTLGKPMAGHAGYANYSKDLQARGETWTFEALNHWLINPKAFVPGTTMGFAGLKNDEARANIMAYINSLGSNLPLPAPKAAEEPVAEEPAVEGGEAVEAGADAPEASDEAATAAAPVEAAH